MADALASARAKALEAMKRRRPTAAASTPAATEQPPIVEGSASEEQKDGGGASAKPRKRRFQLTDAPIPRAPAASADEMQPAEAIVRPAAAAPESTAPEFSSNEEVASPRPKKTRWSSEPKAPAPFIDPSTAMVIATSAASSSSSADATSAAAAAAASSAESARRSRFQKSTFDAAELYALHDTHLPVDFNLHAACAGMTMNQADSILTHMRIDAIHQQLTLIAAGRPIDEVDPLPVDPVTGRPSRARSVSPDPVYDADGKRVNTRLMRLKDRMVRFQKSIVDDALVRNPEFRPPAGWKKMAGGRAKYERKIVVPLDLYPEYNFKGVIIGARGANQQELERSTGCKIAIRGKGSWSENRPDSMRKHYEDDHEPQYVWIQADSEEKLARGVAEIEKRLVPMSDEERSKQLRALALRNGWLGEPRPCRVCGALTHLMRDCPDRNGGGGGTGRYLTNAHVSCQLCGDRSHPTLDCPTVRGMPRHEILAKVERLRASGGGRNAEERTDAEYDAFMSELLGTPAGASLGSTGAAKVARGASGEQLTLMAPPTAREEMRRQIQHQQSEKESCRVYTGADAANSASSSTWSTSALPAFSAQPPPPPYPPVPSYAPVVYAPHLWATAPLQQAPGTSSHPAPPGLW